MYTRFKNQKSGMKLGLSTLANTTTRTSRALPLSSSSSTSPPASLTSPISTNGDLATHQTLLFGSDQPTIILDQNNNFVGTKVTTEVEQLRIPL